MTRPRGNVRDTSPALGWWHHLRMPRSRLALVILVLVLATAVAGTIAQGAASASATVGSETGAAGTPPRVPKEPPGPGSHIKAVKCIYFYWANHRLYRIHAQILRDPAHPTWSSLHARRFGARWDVKPNSLPTLAASFSGPQAAQRATNYIYRHHPYNVISGGRRAGAC
jgi:hypothetical protein